jgi:hypothetical protein
MKKSPTRIYEAKESVTKHLILKTSMESYLN